MRDGLSVFLVVLFFFELAARAQRFSPPAETFHSYEALVKLRRGGDRSGPAQAAEIEGLLKDHGDELAPADGGLISVAAFIDVLPPERLAQIRPEYRQQFDGAARKALEAARQKPGASPESLYAVARRYPLSSIALTAYAEAGDRAALLGDAPAALALFDLAARTGWVADGEHRAVMAQAQGVVKARSGVYCGAIAFDAAWYGRGELAGMPHYYPVACDGLIFFSAPKHVLCFKEGGALVWKYAAPDAWARMFPADRKGLGTAYRPLVFSSAAGAQIVVVRQPKNGNVDSALRAFRAGDGKALWSTDENASFEHLSLASGAAMAGRYLYCTAVEFTDTGATLNLLAIDLLDGHLRFKCAMGMMNELKSPRTDPLGPDLIWEGTAPAVAGDCVYLTPNVGTAFCVGRLDGKLRWTRDYPSGAAEATRYRSTPAACGDVLVMAPGDCSGAMGLDIRTGRKVWANSVAGTIIGHDDSGIFLAGERMECIEAATGREKWHWEPPAHQRITGPPAWAGDVIYVPLSLFKIQGVHPVTGLGIEPKIKPPNFRQLLATDAAHKALEEAAIARTLGVPGASR
jgi:outer membrane protein assembly factor BamB